MQELNTDKFRPDDLTLGQIRALTPNDPDWRDAQFLVLNAGWAKGDSKRIVILCGQSRVRDEQRVHCVGYNTGEAEWLPTEKISELMGADFSVLPKLRP